MYETQVLEEALSVPLAGIKKKRNYSAKVF